MSPIKTAGIDKSKTVCKVWKASANSPVLF